MHLEFFVEDLSTRAFVDPLLRKLLGAQGEPHTWRVHHYRGVGRVPTNLKPRTDASKRILLDQMPKFLRGLGRNPAVDHVVVVVDSDDRDCKTFLSELRQMAQCCGMQDKTLFRLAIEETEAWYFGDRLAVLAAFPKAKQGVLNAYNQDSICGTWELFADAVYPNGSASLKEEGRTAIGRTKSEWATKIGAHIEPDRNQSPSFRKFKDGVRQLTAVV